MSFHQKGDRHGDLSRLYHLRLRPAGGLSAAPIPEDVRRIYGLSQRQAYTDSMRQHRLCQKAAAAFGYYENSDCGFPYDGAKECYILDIENDGLVEEVIPKI